MDQTLALSYPELLYVYIHGEFAWKPHREDLNSVKDINMRVKIQLFSRVHATLHSALSVGWLVGRLVPFYFFYSFYSYQLILSQLGNF